MKSESVLRFSESLCHELEQAFGTSFVPWIRIESDWWWAGAEESLPESSVQHELIRAVLEREGVDREPLMYRLADGRHLLAVPVRNGQQVLLAAVGLIDHEDHRLVRRLAQTILVSLEQQRELEATNARVVEYIVQLTSDFEEIVWLRNLAEMIDICDLKNDIANVAQSTLPALRELIQAEAIYLFEMPAAEESAPSSVVGALRFYEGHGSLLEDRARELIERLQIAAIGQPVVRNAPNRGNSIADVEGVRNCILIRLIRNGFQSGWLLAVNKKQAADFADESPITASALSHWEFGTFEAGLVNAAGGMLATHSRNVQLFREKETLLAGVLRALINTIDAKDAYTHGHSDRVALMSKRMARQLGLSDAECERIYLAGVLHDIGKIGIPDRVLGKAGKLTDEEFAIIKTHPDIGVQILKHLEPLSYVLPGVLHHHEMVNGCGYPHGLAGEAIPLMGRIIAIADAYDAMTSDRPYRQGMPTEKAEDILRVGAGKQWDTRVVEAFFTALPDIHAICGTGGAAPPVRRTKTAAGETVTLPQFETTQRCIPTTLWQKVNSDNDGQTLANWDDRLAFPG